MPVAGPKNPGPAGVFFRRAPEIVVFRVTINQQLRRNVETP